MIECNGYRGVFTLLFLVFVKYLAFAQTNYMEQNFSGSGPFVSANPDGGQFSHLVTTNAATAKFEFGSGYMDMTRLVATGGGLVRAVRAVPFSPNPESLYIQITFSVEEINAADVNALYFYSGENFLGTNSTFPANASLFSRFTIDFLASSFVIHDIQTNKKSSPLPLQAPVTITWVLNNSSDGHIYRKPESSSNPDYKVMPRKYDLWVNETLLVDEADAYPGSSGYSVNKLSNFEIRFWTGVGRVRFGSLRIRDVAGILPLHLVSFDAKRENERVSLSWKTDLEKETDFYIIKRSKDKISYAIIDTVQVKEGTDNIYSSQDPEPFSGINYYRLEKVDKYKNLIESRDLAFSFDSETKVFITPNPSLPDLIQIKTFGAALDFLKIYNLNGHEIDVASKNWNNGILEIQPVQRLCSGLYIISFVQNEKNRFLRFLVE